MKRAFRFYRAHSAQNNFAPFISVCLPVYETEPLLAQCLRSVFLQDFDSFEVIVLSDASRGKDEKRRNAKKITNAVYKECKKLRKKEHLPDISVRFIEHRENMGLVEVRRSLLFYARGSYIAYVDSDDVLEEGALKSLFAATQKQDADIVQGRSTAGIFLPDGSFSPVEKNLYANITLGSVSGYDIIKTWIHGGNLSDVLWAKLFKRTLLEKAFESIPHIECNMAEDFLIFFFTSFYAKTYVGIDVPVYRYRAKSGMSSARKIDSVKKLRMVCSTASVFAVIAESAELKALSESEVQCVRRLSSVYLADNIRQLRETVVPALQDEAHELLCEFWGKNYVEIIEKAVDTSDAQVG
ncbi:MAG: glycosyltransferase family 2 protein [Treponema sp.]|nr:glycosyltransferase family 2 protein [Treponema sp.]